LGIAGRERLEQGQSSNKKARSELIKLNELDVIDEHRHLETRGRFKMASPKSALSSRKTPASGGSLVLQRARGAKGGSLAVNVAADTLEALSPEKSTVKAIMESLGQMIARTRKSGKASGFSVIIDVHGHPQIAPLVQAENIVAAGAKSPSEDDAREAAFAAARARGRIRAAEILDRAEMLSADEMADRLGVSRVTVNARRQRHELLGLDGAKRGFRFPDWQVDDDGRPIEVLPRLFELLGPSPWTVYRFLTQRHDVLNGATAKDALRRGHAEKVLDAAESLARGDFS
jgi:hypothetical protein